MKLRREEVGEGFYLAFGIRHSVFNLITRKEGAVQPVKIIATRSGIVTQMDARLIVFNEFLMCSR
jgi:hypothetical protein